VDLRGLSDHLIRSLRCSAIRNLSTCVRCYIGRGSRFFYAVSRSVICQGDNKQSQICYSGLISGLGTGFLTNLYFPAADRNSNLVTFEDGVIGIGGRAVGNLFQEFVFRRLTQEETLIFAALEQIQRPWRDASGPRWEANDIRATG
jgi:hypothetical protein